MTFTGPALPLTGDDVRADDVCPCRDGRCDCDACWCMRDATGGAVKASPLCERCFLSSEAHPRLGHAPKARRPVGRSDAPMGASVEEAPADVERVARPPVPGASAGTSSRSEAPSGASVAEALTNYQRVKQSCPPGGAIYRRAWPACVFEVDHSLPLDLRVPEAWKDAADWRVAA